MRIVRSSLAAALLIAVAQADTPRASAQDIVATPATIRDFLIQNVCLDRRGAALAGVSPVDGNPGCVDQRDLRPGERLPYHKHDHPNQGDSALLGYQRHDSVPVETAGLGTVVEHSFDFGAGEGRQFGVFDQGSDGGDIAVLSPGRVSFAATEDGGAGFQQLLPWRGFPAAGHHDRQRYLHRTQPLLRCQPGRAVQHPGRSTAVHIGAGL